MARTIAVRFPVVLAKGRAEVSWGMPACGTAQVCKPVRALDQFRASRIASHDKCANRESSKKRRDYGNQELAWFLRWNSAQ